MWVEFCSSAFCASVYYGHTWVGIVMTSPRSGIGCGRWTFMHTNLMHSVGWSSSYIIMWLSCDPLQLLSWREQKRMRVAVMTMTTRRCVKRVRMSGDTMSAWSVRSVATALAMVLAVAMRDLLAGSLESKLRAVFKNQRHAGYMWSGWSFQSLLLHLLPTSKPYQYCSLAGWLALMCELLCTCTIHSRVAFRTRSTRGLLISLQIKQPITFMKSYIV